MSLISPAGQASLTEHLNRIVSSKSVPAAFFGVANADKVIYSAQDGWMDMEDPAAGSVTEHTGEDVVFVVVKRLTELCSVASVFNDQIGH